MRRGTVVDGGDWCWWRRNNSGRRGTVWLAASWEAGRGGDGGAAEQGRGSAREMAEQETLWSRLRLKPLLWPGKKRWRLRNEIDSS
ncbi:unnamed protein product [Linum trigynum]|uniref:Uncharacterized protein n=1 Tax=Linum trigynum TaxID=586398 RepID=A0AAV2G3M2_9ROSI